MTSMAGKKAELRAASEKIAADAAKAPGSLPVRAPPLPSPLFGLLDPGISLIGHF